MELKEKNWLLARYAEYLNDIGYQNTGLKEFKGLLQSESIGDLVENLDREFKAASLNIETVDFNELDGVDLRTLKTVGTFCYLVALLVIVITTRVEGNTD